MARDIGLIAPDLTIPCSAMSSDDVDGESIVCKARILGIWLDTASFR